MKRATFVAMFAVLVGCQVPTGPRTGEWRMVSFCTVTVGQDNMSCTQQSERCWLTYADHVFHCPSGDYATITGTRRP